MKRAFLPVVILALAVTGSYSLGAQSSEDGPKLTPTAHPPVPTQPSQFWLVPDQAARTAASRDAAARFSFLLSAPIVAGAGILKIGEALAGDEVVAWGPLVVGAATAAIVGALVIRVFMGFMQRATLAVFVWYRIALGLAVIAAVATGVL